MIVQTEISMKEFAKMVREYKQSYLDYTCGAGLQIFLKNRSRVLTYGFTGGSAYRDVHALCPEFNACDVKPVAIYMTAGGAFYYFYYDKNTNSIIIEFVGKRNSFKSGCDFIRNWGRKWELISSSQPEREVFA